MLSRKSHKYQIPERPTRAFIMIHVCDKMPDAFSRFGYIHF